MKSSTRIMIMMLFGLYDLLNFYFSFSSTLYIFMYFTSSRSYLVLLLIEIILLFNTICILSYFICFVFRVDRFNNYSPLDIEFNQSLL